MRLCYTNVLTLHLVYLSAGTVAVLDVFLMPSHVEAFLVLVCLCMPLQEHLVLVTELLRANLYEFQKYNRESGDEPYFTLPRIQSIARQVRGAGHALFLFWVV